MSLRIRLFPIVIFVAALMLSVKLGGIWNTFSEPQGSIEIRAAVAQDKPKKDTPAAAKAKPAPRPEGTKPVVEIKDEDANSVGDVSKLSYSEIRLLQELAGRRKALDKRERKLQQRTVLLKAAEQRLVEKQNELKKIKAGIKELLDIKDKEESKRLDRLVGIYSNMKPKDAAKIFDDLDMKVLLDVMQSMKERKIAPIVAAMDAKRARLLTKQLAERQTTPKIPK